MEAPQIAAATAALQHQCCHEPSQYASVHGVPQGTPCAVHTCVVKTSRVGASTAQWTRFQTIVQTLSALWEANPVAFNQQYIAPVSFVQIASGTTSPGMVLVTPRYANKDILTYLINHPHVSPLYLLIELSKAVAHIHFHKLVHGHLHAGNCLITDQHHMALTDICVFTLASQFGLEGVRYRASNRFMSPEFNQSPDSPPTQAADIYSLGAIIYYAYTINSGWTQPNMNEVIVHGHRRIPPPPSHIMHPRIWQLVTACWSDDPLDRPTAAQVVMTLEHVFRGL